MRFIAVDLERSDKPGTPAFTDEARHKLELENDRVRVYRIKLAAGGSLSAHSHSAGWLAVTVAGGKEPGTYQWHGANAANPVNAGTSGLEIVELEPR